MSELQNLLVTLDGVTKDAEQHAARLAQHARQLGQAASGAASATQGSARTDSKNTAAALQSAQRSVSQAAQQLHQAALAGKSFVARYAVSGGSTGVAIGGTEEGPGSTEQVLSGGSTQDLRNSPDNAALVSALEDMGLSLQPVARFDYRDNPILGYRESAPPADVAYAVKMWDEQIAPGIATGAKREDFAAYDEEHGLEGHQRLAGVYDYMLGDPIWGDVRPNGTINPGGGRHRLDQAYLNDVSFVPFRTGGRGSRG